MLCDKLLMGKQPFLLPCVRKQLLKIIGVLGLTDAALNVDIQNDVPVQLFHLDDTLASCTSLHDSP